MPGSPEGPDVRIRAVPELAHAIGPVTINLAGPVR